MPWLLFLLATAALVAAPMLGSLALAMACVLISMLLTLCATLSLLADRAAHGAASLARRKASEPGLSPPAG